MTLKLKLFAFCLREIKLLTKPTVIFHCVKNWKLRAMLFGHKPLYYIILDPLSVLVGSDFISASIL